MVTLENVLQLIEIKAWDGCWMDIDINEFLEDD